MFLPKLTKPWLWGLACAALLLSGCVSFGLTQIDEELPKTFEPTIHYVNTLLSADFVAMAPVSKTAIGPNSDMAPALALSLQNAFGTYSPFMNPVVEKSEGAVIQDDEYYMIFLLQKLVSEHGSYDISYAIQAMAYVLNGKGDIFLAEPYLVLGSSALHIQDAQDKAVKLFLDEVYADFSAIDFSSPLELSEERTANIRTMLTDWY
ncbi:hypothetical protein [Spirochaeta lutea]|uniref:Lipoprotein n=1 Tax=Spirochaeta lutea TaxID=1480694 RepID=A0A098QX86_9SPIO|nr:hypothetical protein [Spirochaeta lutea]KGE72171.1 hypothetical protein DC28_07695 [Spirochaeta lutea]